MWRCWKSMSFRMGFDISRFAPFHVWCLSPIAAGVWALATMFHSRSWALTLWNCKSKLTFSFISCLDHSVLPQQQETKTQGEAGSGQ